MTLFLFAGLIAAGLPIWFPFDLATQSPLKTGAEEPQMSLIRKVLFPASVVLSLLSTTQAFAYCVAEGSWQWVQGNGFTVNINLKMSMEV